MTFEIRFFARARDLAGAEKIALDLPQADDVDDPVTLARLKEAMSDRLPALVPWLPHLLFAVGTEYADDSTILDSQSEIACFPTVSGG